MAKVKIFKVSKTKGGPQYTVKLTAGSTPADEAWKDLNLSEDDVNNKAIQSVVIDLQGAMRRNWPKDQAAAQVFVDNWAAGQRASYAVRVSPDDVKKAKFSKEQIEILKAAGVQF